MRSLCLLLGGLGRFVPCSIGANQCRLRHLGWERCGHGLTSRPRESASVPFFDQLLLLFHYLPGSSGALLAGSLPLRYCSSKFASRTPFWVLLVPGYVAGLITDETQAALVVMLRLLGKTPAHLVGRYMHARPRVWKRLHCFGYLGVSDDDCRKRRCNHHGGDGSPVHPRTGVG